MGVGIGMKVLIWDKSPRKEQEGYIEFLIVNIIF